MIPGLTIPKVDQGITTAIQDILKFEIAIIPLCQLEKGLGYGRIRVIAAIPKQESKTLQQLMG
jgi:hypothetical protein